MTEFDKVIPPGGVGKVTASLDTEHYRGPISKSVTVTTKGASPMSVVLELKAQIVSAIDVLPTDMPLVTGLAGEVKATEVTVSSSDGRPFDILAVQSDPTLTVVVRPPPGVRPKAGRTRTGQPRAVASGSNRYLVGITAGKDVPVGRSVGTVTLTTDVAKAKAVVIRVVMTVTGRVQVNPPELVGRAGADAHELHTRIKKVAGGGLAILGVTVSDPDFALTTSTIVEGSEYDIAARYTGKPGRGAVSGVVTVKTNEPGQETIFIPLGGQM